MCNMCDIKGELVISDMDRDNMTMSVFGSDFKHNVDKKDETKNVQRNIFWWMNEWHSYWELWN